MSTSLVDDDHPLLLELKSIRAALAQCREESLTSAIKLQRHSFYNAQGHERATRLQRENDLLKSETTVLRGTPIHSESSWESNAQVQQLTLSQRKLSHKLTLTEELLLEKTKALLTAQADVVKAEAARDTASQLVMELRATEDTGMITIKGLEMRIQKQEEELRMLDVVICDYAELVRQMESRQKTSDPLEVEANITKASTIESALSKGLFDLQDMTEVFEAQYVEKYQELAKLQGELEIAHSQLDAKRHSEEAIIENFARTKAELEQLKVNDETASRMVARYMQFSQSSTNSLLDSLEAVKTRHAATLSTLSSQNQLLLARMQSLELQNEHLRTTLDELGREVLKEKYGRRREVSFRIRMGGREERIAEGLRRWVRQIDEAFNRLESQEMERQEHDTLLNLSQDARILLDGLERGGADEASAISISGSRAREVIVRGGVDELLEELRIETERRVMLQVKGNETLQADKESKFKSPGPAQQDSRDTPSLLDQADDESTVVAVSPSSSDVKLVSAITAPISEEAAVYATVVDPIQTRYHRTDSTVEQPPIESGPSSPMSDTSPMHLREADMLTASQLTQEDTTSTSDSVCSSRLPTPTETLTDSSSPSLTGSGNPTSLPTPEESMPTILEEKSLPHPLLVRLANVQTRYDVFQREFRDCHLALESLKESMKTFPSVSARTLPVEFLQTAVARLDDFTEDVRVELEIKIGDEALLVKGYEALLRISHQGNVGVSADVEGQITAYIDGTDPTVKSSLETFTVKLLDAQHDIAVLKRAIHDPESLLSEQPSGAGAPNSAKHTLTPNLEPNTRNFIEPSWPSLTGRSSPESTTAGFGLLSVMSNQSKGFPPRNPLGRLDLRIVTPSYDISGNVAVSPTPFSATFGGLFSPSHPSGLGLGLPSTPRSRATSTVYNLGLGALGRSASLSADINCAKASSDKSTKPKDNRKTHVAMDDSIE